MTRVLGLAVFVLVAGACGDSPSAPEISVPDRAIDYDPPVWFAGWYEAMEECVEADGDFGRVRWFLVPGGYAWLDEATGDSLTGAWLPPHDIYLAGGRTTDREVVEHQMAHEIIQTHEHPAPAFGECPSRTDH